MVNTFLKKSPTYILLIFIGLSFLYGVLSYQHYAPSSHDFYINAIVFFFCSIGLFIFFMKNYNLKIKLNNLLWILLFIIFFIQPVVNNIIYVDGLIFPLAQVLLILILSIAVSNIEDKKYFVDKMAIILVIGSLLLFVTQIIHVFKISFLAELMRLPLQTQRFSGNLFQPNQTAFVFILGIISTIFIFNNNKEKIKFLIIFLLSVGVSFTVSRAGFLMLLFFSFIFNIVNNYVENKKIMILKDFLFVIFGLIIGIFLYSNFSESPSALGRVSESFNDVRLNFLHQTALIVLDHPIAGVGWKNFASTSLQYYEQVGWLSLTDHSHFIFGQLISEFGLLGVALILFFFFIFIKNIAYVRDKNDVYILLVLLIFILYSCFEYPLWYFRYLMIFSIFFALFDRDDRKFYIVHKGYLIAFITSLLLFASIYYIFQYRKIAYLNDIVFDSNVSDRVKFEKIVNTKFDFGFSYFNDLFLYQSISTDGFLLKDSIEIGERLVNYIPMNQFLIKQGTLMGLDRQEEKSYNYFKASCYYHRGQECENTKKYLNSLSQQYPTYFEGIYKKIDSGL